MRTLVHNGSKPALTLFAQRMTDDRFDEDEKTSWLRTHVIDRRNDLQLLLTMEQLIPNLPAELATYAEEVLFDYRPEDWYRPHKTHSPPLRSDLEWDGQQTLIRIGETTLAKQTLDPRLRTAVELTLKELRDRER